MVASPDPGIASAATPAPDARPGPGRFLLPLSWSAGTAAAAVAAMICYLRIAGTVPVISDGAGNALQAWDLLHGNLLLHGWWVTDVSFYTTELPQYALVEAAAGLRPEVVHICAAMTYLVRSLWSREAAAGPDGAATASAAAQADLVGGLLPLAILANLALYIFMYPVKTLYNEHEIAPVLALGAALAGRELGGPLARLCARRLARVVLAPALAALLACYGAMLGYAAATLPQPPPANAAVAVWLAGHHLHSGIAQYWEASSVTLDTHGAITMGSVGPDPGGLAPWHWEMDMRLFNPATHSANFVLSMPGDVVTPARAVLAFGHPARVWPFRIYTILVWNKNILPELGSPIPR